MTPGDLTPPAEADLADVLKRGFSFGPGAARRMGGRLAAHFRRIENGEAVGHRHRFLALPDHVRCIVEPPLVIFYDKDTRLVLRIVDGRRDLAELFRLGRGDRSVPPPPRARQPCRAPLAH